MRNYSARLATVAVGLVAAVGALAFMAAPVRAQVTAPPPPGDRDPFSEVRERQQREAQLRSGDMMAVAKRPERRTDEAAAEQMRVDFKNLQLLRNKLARHLLSDKPLDYKFIAGESGEINKRAVRLKTYLMREVLEGEEDEVVTQNEVGDGRVKESLVAMCKRIDRFTENPIFKTQDVVDAKQSARAGRDLRDIIHLSGGIKRTADKLRKMPNK